VKKSGEEQRVLPNSDGRSLVEEMAKINRALAVAAALLGAAAWFQPSVAGSDLWWHLAAGREIVAQRGVSTVDHFSFTFAGQPWMHHEWLWGTGYWLVYQLAPDAVALANLALIFAIFALWLAIARSHSGSDLGAGAALWASAATSYWFLDIRPHEVTLLFVGVVVATRGWPRARWLWAPLMALWCNLHGGFVFGMGAIGLFALVETLESSLESHRLRVEPTLWLGVALAALAFLCNPWGWHILEYPIAYLDADSPFRAILEWQPPPFDLDLRGFSGRFFWLLAAGALGAALELRARLREGRRSGDVYLVSLAAVTASMALTSRRFIPLFALTSLPLTARLVASVASAVDARLPERVRSGARKALAPAALAVALLLWRDVRVLPHPLSRWTESHLYPRAALHYLESLEAGPRVLNYYNWGGYMMLHAPELKVLIDGRANTLYSERIYNDYVAMIAAADGLAARLAIYAPDVALLPVGSRSLASKLASPEFGWQVAYSDDVAAVLLPPGSPRLRRPLPQPDDVVGDEPQWLLARASGLTARGDPRAARALVERVLESDSLLARAYGALAESYAAERDTAGIAAAIDRGLAVEPRFAPTLRQFEAAAYEAAGDPERALAALERAVPRGPFSRPEGVLRNVQLLRARLGRR
jgi:tetratricopeptide (TPR) repeat protein